MKFSDNSKIWQLFRKIIYYFFSEIFWFFENSVIDGVGHTSFHPHLFHPWVKISQVSHHSIQWIFLICSFLSSPPHFTSSSLRTYHLFFCNTHLIIEWWKSQAWFNDFLLKEGVDKVLFHEVWVHIIFSNFFSHMKPKNWTAFLFWRKFAHSHSPSPHIMLQNRYFRQIFFYIHKKKRT